MSQNSAALSCDGGASDDASSERLLLFGKGMWILIATVLVMGGSAMAESQRVSVDGTNLGFYPLLADGVQIESGVDGKSSKFTRTHRCLERVVSREGVDAGVNLTGYSGSPTIEVAYPLGGEGGGLLPPPEVVKAYVEDNFRSESSADVMKLLFVPQILTPRPERVIHADWTTEARRILNQHDEKAFRNFCGTHFVSARGEDNYVIYSIRIQLADVKDRPKFDRLFEDIQKQSPSLVLDSLNRMRQRFEFINPQNRVVLDVLHIGDSEEELAALKSDLMGWRVRFVHDNGDGVAVTRATVECVPDRLEPCEKLARGFLDFQFGRFNFKGTRPTFSPVRFRLTPFAELME